MATFHSSIQGDIHLLEVSGRIEPDHWKSLKEALEQTATAASAKPKGVLLVDLEKLEYIASSGFRELFLTGRQMSRDGGFLAVCALQGEVKRVFQLAGFATAYPIFETRQAALAHFGC